MRIRKRRVRRGRLAGEWELRRHLGSRISALLSRANVKAPPQGQRDEQRYSAIDNEHGFAAEVTRHSLDADEGRAIAPLTAKLEKRHAKRRHLGRHLGDERKKAAAAAPKLAEFDRRLGNAVELSVTAARWLPLAVLIAIAGLLVPDYSFNRPAFEFAAPASATGGFIGTHLDIICAIVYTATQGLFAKYAGKHTAWALSPLVIDVHGDDKGEEVEDGAPSGRKAFVTSEWTRRQHAAFAAALWALVLASVIAIIHLRVPALNLNNQLEGGQSTGLIGQAGNNTEAQVSGTLLAMVSLLPLSAAAFLAGFAEGPLRATRRKLAADCDTPQRRAIKTSKTIDKLDAALAKIGQSIERIQRETTIDKHSTRVEVAYRREVAAEKEPDFYGYYGTDRTKGFPSEEETFKDALLPQRPAAATTADAVREAAGDLTGEQDAEREEAPAASEDGSGQITSHPNGPPPVTEQIG